MIEKPRVLLNWDTERKDLLEPFVRLHEHIEFIIIWGDYVQEEKRNHPFRQISFKSYRTPYALLKDIKPDKVLFFNINSFPQVALNLAAHNLGITTYVMHHGIHHSDFLEIVQRKAVMEGPPRNKLTSNFQTFRFYFSALKFKNLAQLPAFIRFAWYRKRMERLLAAEKCVFPARLPDWYINLSPHNAIAIKKVDHIKDDTRFIYIGHPFFDRILSDFAELQKQSAPVTEKYWLLIDFPNNDNVVAFKLMGASGKEAFYKQLSAIAKGAGYRLKIKLHPFGYDSVHNYQDDNIDLIREADIGRLIFEAAACFSFFSTLLIPVIYAKGFCHIFHIGEDRHLQAELVELGVGIKLDVFNFSESDLVYSSETISEMAQKVFVERYLYYPDGHATERLCKVLTDENDQSNNKSGI
ncbi:MAG: hypothetical protein GXC78_12445 [Chitinophagaceae bacterium]|jgi:hypothetical protein|nr:hypothetical protein [Chitinophagaceae bacterium]